MRLKNKYWFVLILLSLSATFDCFCQNIELAVNYYQQKNFKQSVQELKAIIKDNGRSNPKVQSLLVRSYLALKDPVNAKVALNLYKQLVPQYQTSSPGHLKILSLEKEIDKLLQDALAEWKTEYIDKPLEEVNKNIVEKTKANEEKIKEINKNFDQFVLNNYMLVTEADMQSLKKIGKSQIIESKLKSIKDNRKLGNKIYSEIYKNDLKFNFSRSHSSDEYISNRVIMLKQAARLGSDTAIAEIWLNGINSLVEWAYFHYKDYDKDNGFRSYEIAMELLDSLGEFAASFQLYNKYFYIDKDYKKANYFFNKCLSNDYWEAVFEKKMYENSFELSSLNMICDSLINFQYNNTEISTLVRPPVIALESMPSLLPRGKNSLYKMNFHHLVGTDHIYFDSNDWLPENYREYYRDIWKAKQLLLGATLNQYDLSSYQVGSKSLISPKILSLPALYLLSIHKEKDAYEYCYSIHQKFLFQKNQIGLSRFFSSYEENLSYYKDFSWNFDTEVEWETILDLLYLLEHNNIGTIRSNKKIRGYKKILKEIKFKGYHKYLEESFSESIDIIFQKSPFYPFLEIGEYPDIRSVWLKEIGGE